MKCTKDVTNVTKMEIRGGNLIQGYSRKAVSEDLTFIHIQGANLEITGQTSGCLVQGDALGERAACS